MRRRNLNLVRGKAEGSAVRLEDLLDYVYLAGRPEIRRERPIGQIEGGGPAFDFASLENDACAVPGGSSLGEQQIRGLTVQQRGG
jgi:hypothetical protein